MRKLKISIPKSKETVSSPQPSMESSSSGSSLPDSNNNNNNNKNDSLKKTNQVSFDETKKDGFMDKVRQAKKIADKKSQDRVLQFNPSLNIFSTLTTCFYLYLII